MIKDWEMSWESERQLTRPKLRLERARSELPRGGKDMASQIGAELRLVFGPPVARELAGADEMLSKMDKSGLE